MKCLISCIEARNKYMGSLGGADQVLEDFDLIIDAAQVAVPERKKMGVDPAEEHADQICSIKVKTVTTESQLKNLLEKNKPKLSLVFRVQGKERTNTDVIFDIVEANSDIWGVIANKSLETKPLRLANPLRPLGYIFNRYLYRFTKTYYPDLLFTNSIFTKISSVLKKLKPREIKIVPHMDAAKLTVEERKSDTRVGVFLSSYLPFHGEVCRQQKIHINPELFYEELKGYFEKAKQKYKLEKIVIARHPNSLGEELDFFEGYNTYFGETEKWVSKAAVVFNHYSESVSFAAQHNKKIVCVYLKNSMPQKLYKECMRLSRRLSVDLDIYSSETDQIKTKKSNYLLHRFKMFLYKSYFKKDAKSLTEHLEEIELNL